MSVSAGVLTRQHPGPGALGRVLFFVAACTVGLTVGQALASIAPQTKPAQHSAAPAPAPAPRISIKIEKTAVAGQLLAIFPAGTSADLAQLALQGYGLTFVSGDPAIGHFLFSLPQITVTQLTDSTGLVVFPAGTARAEALTFLVGNRLRLLHWARPSPEDIPALMAQVALPLAPPVAAAPARPNNWMRTTLPRGLSLAYVSGWARAHGLRLISYSGGSGATTLQPLNRYAPATFPPAYFVPPSTVKKVHPPVPPRSAVFTPPPAPAAHPGPPASLFISFTASTTPQAINDIAVKFGLQLTTVGSTGIMLATVDSSRATALKQMLSDLSAVQCVGATLAACATTSASVAATSPAATSPTTSSAPPAGPVLATDGLPAAGRLAGKTTFAVTVQSANGPVKVSFSVSGPLGAADVGTVSAQSTGSAGSTASIPWDSATVADGTYTLHVVATDAAGQSTAVDRTYRIQNAAPSAPTQLGAALTDSGVALSWQQPAVADAKLYRVYRDQNDLTQIFGGLAADEHSFIDVSAAAGSHHYQVVLVDAADHVSAPTAVDLTVPTSTVFKTGAAYVGLSLLTGAGEPLKSGGVAGNLLQLRAQAVPSGETLRFEYSADNRAWAPVAAPTACTDVCRAQWPVALAPGHYIVRATTLDGALTSTPASFVVAAPAATRSASTLTPAAGAAPPTAISSVRATVDGLSVHLAWAPSSDPAMTYDVYRVDPSGSGLILAASGLDQSSFTDSALQPGQAYGYTVVAHDATGQSSPYAAPVFVQSGSPRAIAAPTFVTPPAVASNASSLPIVLTAFAETPISSVTLAVQRSGQATWNPLPDALPVNLPVAEGSNIASAAGMVWASTWNTAALPPDDYILRAIVSDALAGSSQQTETVRVDGQAARAPPSIDLHATAISSGVRLDWTGTGGTEFQVLRSALTMSGPLETIGTTTLSQFFDQDLVPGTAYTYQVVQAEPAVAVSNTATAFPLPPGNAQLSLLGGSETVSLSGPDAASSVDIVALPSAAPLPVGLTAHGPAFRIGASSLASGKPLGRFTTPTSLQLTATNPSELSLYQWSDWSQSWQQVESLGSDGSRRATLNRPGIYIAAAGTARGQGGPAASAVPSGATELADRRTLTSRTYRNTDGTYTMELASAPINFLDAGGAWQPIDSSLTPVTADGYAYRNTANSFATFFKSTLQGDYLRVDAGGSSYGFALEGAAPRTAQSSGTAGLSYPGVFPGVDLTDSSNAFGVKETLVLSSASAPNHYRFVLSQPPGSALTPVQKSDGSWAFVKNGAMTPAFVLSAADAYQQPAEAGEMPIAAGHATTSVTRAGGRFLIDVTIDPAWLADPARRFPVYLDPSITIQPSVMESYWHWNVPTEGPQWDQSGYLHVGDSDQHIDRATYQFDTSVIPAGVTITSAQLGLYYNGYCIDTTVSCGQYHTLEAHRMTSPWNYQSTTSQLTYDSSVLSSTQVDLFGASQWYYWSVTSAVQNWYSGSWTNDGLIVMRNPDNVLGVSGPVFPDAWYGDGSIAPELTVTWNAPNGVTVPGAPTNVAATPADSRATVSWTAPTSTGGAPISSYTVQTFNAAGQQISVQNVNNQYEYNFTVCGTCTSVQIYGLSNGNKYGFQVSAANSAGSGPATTTTWISTPPDIQWASITPNQGIYTVGQAVQFSFTVANHVTDSGMNVSSIASNSSVFAGGGGPMTIDGLACTATSSPSCSFNGTTLTIGNFTLPASQSHTFTYQAIAQGLNAGCQQVAHPLSATNQAGINSNVYYWLNLCDSGLGIENWWSYVPFDVGPQAQALVNVANGNLVLQQTDSTPIQAHGRFAYVLRRTYNSQDTGLLSQVPAPYGLPNLPGQFGIGWQLNVDDLSGGAGASGLVVPQLQSVLNPLSVTLIDRDGTRHVFTFKGLGASISALDLTTYVGTGALLPVTIGVSPNRSGDHICIDQNFQAPPGVHIGLWRYVEITPTGGATCQNPQAGNPVMIGFGAERTDRIRYEFSADGHMLDMRDGNGVDLRYRYLVPPLGGLTGLALGPLTAIYEARSCNDPFQNPKCRAFRFTYIGTGETDISDPAGRTTRYYFTPTGYLSKVINPDGSQIGYTYCNGITTTINNQTVNLAQQLCSMTDPAGMTTTFGYGTASVGPNPVTSVTDRRNVQTTFSYGSGYQYLSNWSLYYQNGSTSENQAGQQHGFNSIDSVGRVGERDDGVDANGNWEQRTFTYWDQDYWGNSCRRPDAAPDNNPCEIFTPSLNSQTPDQDTLYVYNDEGQVTDEHKVIPTAAADEETTYGYHAQYFRDDNTVLTYDDTVSGGGDVNNQAPPSGPRNDAHSLFVISDKTQMLSPRGNTPGAAGNATDAYGAEYGYRNYLTTYVVDDNSAFNPNAIPSANTCSYPSRPIANTGNVCEVDGPSYDGIHPTVTRYTYDTFGQRLTMTTPDEIANNPHWSFIQSHYNILSSGINDAGTGGTSLSDTFGTPVTSGNRVLVAVSLFSSSGTSPAVTGVTGTSGTFTRLTAIKPNGDSRGEVSVWSTVASSTGTYSVTVSTNVASDIGLSLAEYSGLASGSSPVDVQVSGIGNGATPSSGPTAATTAADELVLSVYGDEGGGKTMSTGSGFIPRVLYGNPTGPSFGVGTIVAFMSDQDSGPSGSTASCQWVSNTDNNWACLAIVLKLATPASSGTPYSYTYYQDGTQASNYTDCDTDLSGNVCAGGWLKGITDPNGKFVAFAYDAAGNVTRTWDRNATNGYTLSQFPGTISSPTNSSYSETLHSTQSSSLTAYFTGQADPNLGSANLLSSTVPSGSEVGSATTVGTATGWGELYALGNSSPWPGGSSEPGPSNHGWQLDSGLLEGNSIPAGTWQINSLALQLSTAGTVVADIHVRAYRRTASGWYYYIGDWAKPAASISNAKSLFTFTGTTSQATDFGNGDHLYLDVWLYVTSNTASTGAAITLWMNNSTIGESVTTPGYQGTNAIGLAPYLTSTTDVGTGLLGLPGRQLTVAGAATESSATSTIGSALGWGELPADGTASAWPAASSAPAPSGHGWVLDTTALEGRTIVTGVWQAGSLKFGLSSTGTVTADIYLRVWKRSASGTYTSITNIVGSGLAISNANPVFSFSSSGIWSVSLGVGDKIYVDVVLNVTSNTAPTGSTISLFDNNLNVGEQLLTPGTKPNSYSPYSFPWRFVTHSRLPDGSTTYTQPDLDGNVVLIQPPRGYNTSSSAYNITQTFDAGGNLLTRTMPAEAAIGKSTQYAYDSWNNVTSTTDADGNVTVYQYDDLNRQIHKVWTRGPWPTDQTQVPAGCRESTTSDAPIAAGRILCSTTTAYDSLNNPTSVTDASGATTQYVYDAFHRKISQLVPRNDGSITSTRTDYVYDANGNLTDVCSPNEFTVGGSTGCVQPGYYSQHTTYDFLDRPVATTTYRQADTAPVTELIQNGGFENGLTSWTSGGSPAPSTSTAQAHSGTSSALIGATTTACPNCDPWIYQTITIPQTATRATLSFWYRPQSDTYGSQNAWQGAYIRDSAGNVLQSVSYLDSNAQSWTPVVFDLTQYAGQTIQVYFEAQQDGNYNKTAMYLDDVSVKVQSATSTNAVQNGGFESGTLAAWTGQGLKPAQVTNARAHSGSYSALLGWTASPEPEGDSSMLQTVTIPASATRASLNFWYFPSSTDNGNDRQEVWVLDTNLNKLAQVLYTVDANNQAWIPVGYDMTPFAGKTVVLWFNVHGYQSTGLTSMYVDDVQLTYVNSSNGPAGLVNASTTTVGYDADGNRVSVTDPNGNTVTDAYNYLDQRVSETKPRDASNSFTTTWAYDPAGHVTSMTDPSSKVTAYSYDVNGRPVDSVGGSDNVIAGSAGNATGGTDTRTRLVYDRDGHVYATYSPNAFMSSVSSPNASYMTATDFNVDGLPVASYSPRYGHSATDLGLSSTQTTQCPTGASPQVGAYPSDVGVCITGFQYDPAGNRSKDIMATAPGTAVTTTLVQTSNFHFANMGGGPQTFSQGSIAGHMAVIFSVLGDGGFGSASSVTDNAGNSWQRIALVTTSNTVYDELWVAYNIRAFSSITINYPTLPNQNTIGTVAYLEYANVGSLDTVTTASQSGVASATVGPTAAVGVGELALAMIGYWNYNGSTESNSISGGWTDRVNTGAASNDMPLQLSDNLGTHAGGQSATWTLAQSDSPGEILAVFHASNSNRFTSYNYTDDRLLQSVDGPDPNANGAQMVTTTYLYDADGRPTKITDALGHVTTISYFADGLKQQECAPPNGSQTHCTTYAYDANGNIKAVTDARNLTTTSNYYADNRLQSVTDGAGDTTSYTYDLGGRVATVCSPSCNARDTTNPYALPTSYQYFKDNLIQWSRQPFFKDGSIYYQTTYGYDSAGLKTSQDTMTVNGSGTVITDPGSQTFSYYNNDRLDVQTGRGGSGTITDTYDANGNITSAADTTGSGNTITSTFYLDDKPRTVDNGTKTNKYTYDGAGQTAARTDITDSGGATASTTTYTYNDAGLASSMTASAAGANPTTYAYNSLGQPTQENDPNGQYTTYSYNLDNSLASKVLKNSSGTTLNSWTYQYDGDLHITQQLTPSKNSYYWYDNANRVCYYSTTAAQSSCSPATYTYDHDGNRLSAPGVSFSYNADDSMNSDGGGGFVYTPYQALQTADGTNYGYDGLNRMNSAGGTSYQNDAFDRQRQVGSTTVHYDGFSQTPTIETTGSTDKVYALDASGSPKAVQNGSSAPEYLTDDGHGNIANVTGTGQTITCGVQYDPWGNPVGGQGVGNPCATGSTSSDVFYRSARRDSNTGDYQFGFRTYDPTRAGFLSSDVYRSGTPEQNQGLMVDPLTMDRYNYVNGDPVNLVDVNGHKVCAQGDPNPDCDSYRPGTQYNAQQNGGKDQAYYDNQAAQQQKANDEAAARYKAWQQQQHCHIGGGGRFGAVRSCGSDRPFNWGEFGQGLLSGTIDLALSSAVMAGCVDPIFQSFCEQRVFDMGVQAAHDPKKFFGDMLGNAIDLKDFQTGHTERAIGYNIPAVVLTLATGGEGAAAKATGEPLGMALFRSLLGRGAAGIGDDALPFIFRGGRFADLKTGTLDNGLTLERHHLIADAISPYSRAMGPSIQMEALDHVATESWGPSGAAYRAAQKALVDQGDTGGAFSMEIKSIRSLFGSKYDDAIIEALNSLGI